MDVKHFKAMAVDGANLVGYDRSCFERYTASKAWKRQQIVLSRWRAKILLNARFADVLFVWCEEELSYC